MDMKITLDPSMQEEIEQLIKHSFVDAVGHISNKLVKPYLTRDEVCEILGISRNFLSKLEKKGLPVVKIGRKQMISWESLNEFLKAHEQ